MLLFFEVSSTIPKLVSGVSLNEAKKNILALGQKQSEKSCRHVSIIVRGGKVKQVKVHTVFTALCQASRILLIMLLEVAAEMTLL